MDLDRIYPLTTRVKSKAALFTADGRGELHAIEVMDRFEIKLSDAFHVNILTAKGKSWTMSMNYSHHFMNLMDI